MVSLYQNMNVIGLCMGWDGSLVAGETVANVITALSLLLLALQLFYLIVSKPNSVWTISRLNIVRILFSLFILFLALQRVAFIANIFYPCYYLLAIMDTICALLSIVNCVLIRQLTIVAHKL